MGYKVPSSSIARVHPTTDRLGVAGAAQDTGRGLLSPGESVAGAIIKVTDPRVVVQIDDTK